MPRNAAKIACAWSRGKQYTFLENRAHSRSRFYVLFRTRCSVGKFNIARPLQTTYVAPRMFARNSIAKRVSSVESVDSTVASIPENRHYRDSYAISPRPLDSCLSQLGFAHPLCRIENQCETHLVRSWKENSILR